MVATSSTMLPLASSAPDFILTDAISGQTFDFSKISASEGYLICFICNHCPYVIHLLDHLGSKLNEWHSQGFCVLGVCSNDQVNYPADAPDKMKELGLEKGFSFPYLHDSDQSVAKLYQASCTPDFFLFNQEKELFYRGQYDSSRPGNSIKVDGEDLIEAMRLLVDGEQPPKVQKPSLGCNIKWKVNSEPDYYLK